MTDNRKITIYFMRHGETYLNKYNRMQGWSNAPLTENGKRDVIRSGRGLALTKFDAVYTSDLARTVDTAKMILHENQVSSNVEIVQLPEFREVFFGSFEGLDAKESWGNVRARAEQKYGRLPDGSENFVGTLNTLRELDPAGDAEDYMTLWMRIERGLLKLLTEHNEPEQTLLVVAHGLVINLMLAAIVPGFSVAGPIHNASVSVVHYQNGQFSTSAVNSTAHFK